MSARYGFATEVDLCAAFMAWQQERFPDLRCYAECGGWDILVVYPDGRHLGIQAKLRMNADVVVQATPDPRWDTADTGPDYRAVLVPNRVALSELAERCGLVVFYCQSYERGQFWPKLEPDASWLEWNPARRDSIPTTPTDSVAGSPCPITLTPWKQKALSVLAWLTVHGTITRQQVRVLGVDPRRWFTEGWLVSAGEGIFVRGSGCPPFDAQHPTAYAAALESARNVTP